MVESKIYIGLNDLASNTQLFENEKYISILRKVCHSYRVPFSFSVQEGGYIYESGEYAKEICLVLTLIDVENRIDAYFIRERLEYDSKEDSGSD